MIDKPDPAKDAGRTDASGVKRPHATLDIKATEVKPATPGTSPSAAAVSAPGASSTGGPAASTSSASAASAAKAASAGDASSSKASAPSAATKPAAPAKPEPKASRSAGGFFSHLAAGVIGGALVYAGAAFLGPNWIPGLPGADSSDLAARIAALEAAPKDGADIAALGAKIDDVESRAAKIDALERDLTALQAETKSLSDAARQSDATANDARIAKLEEQLSLIASGSSGASGGVQQLAAVSGKISDVQTSLAAQIADLRKSLPQDLDQKLAAAEATARSLSRELSEVRTEQARTTQKADAAKADTDRISGTTAAAKEDVARLSTTVGELRSSVDSQLKSFAKPADVAAAVNPINSKLAELDQRVQTIANNEQSRRQNAERIVLSLELSNLKRALDRGQGQGYAAELEEVRKAAGGQLDLAPLERFKDTGVATPAELKAAFRPLINAVIDADLEPADGSVIDRLLAGAKSVVRVRKVSHDADDTSTEAIVARMETALNDGRLGDVLAQSKSLPQRARVPIEDWLIKVTARDTVDQAIAAVDAQLKASLAGAPAEPAAAPAPVQN